MYHLAFELDITRDYLILDKLVEGGEELVVLPTANILEREPTYALDRWKEYEPGLIAWNYPDKKITLIAGLYWVAGIYGLYNIDREKIWIGSSQQLRKRWNTHLTARRHGLANELQQDLKAGNRFLFCVLQVLEIYSEAKRSLWWDARLPTNSTQLRIAEQGWMDRLPKECLYNQRRAYRR
jgi:hypothetical protein